MSEKSAVRIFEVGPRDGLQSERTVWAASQRLKLIELLMRAGLSDIEVGSFVRADRVPQMANTGKVLKGAIKLRKSLSTQTRFWAFIPNENGLNDALESGVDACSFFVAASDTFCIKNVNRTQKQLYAELKPLLRSSQNNKKSTRVYLSTIAHCPYEDDVPATKVATTISRLLDYGVKEIVLSDTTGRAHPLALTKLFDLIDKRWAPKHFALHLHDTYGYALANVHIGLKFGIKVFDASIGGLGGCPYAPGASGNLATEDLLNFLNGYRQVKGPDFNLLMKAAAYAQKHLGRPLNSKQSQILRKA